MKRSGILWILTGIMLLTLPMIITSCSSPQDDSPLKGSGKVAVYITDAPFPADMVEKVLVTVDSVELRIRGGECKTEEGDTVGDGDPNDGNNNEYKHYDCDQGFVMVLDEPAEVDLMQLRNGIVDLLAEAELPVGKYDMIRLYITDALIVIDGDQSFPLKIPGGEESGLKIFLSEPLEVTESGVAEVLIDVDLSRSFVALGNPKNKKGITGFIFKPVIRAVRLAASGSIKGKVTDAANVPVEQALVTVLQSGEPVTTALTGEEGVFRVIGLPAGTYDLTIDAEGFKQAVVSDVVVTKKQEVLKNIKLQTE